MDAKRPLHLSHNLTRFATGTQGHVSIDVCS